MKITKSVLYFYALILSVCASASVLNLQHLDSEIIQNHGVMGENCVCLPKSQVHTSVRNILDPKQNGLERLVVFIYFDPRTDSTSVFIPNANIQKMIPDVPYENHEDILSAMPESASIFFKHNPNRIILDRSIHLNHVYDVNVEPMDINTEKVESIYKLLEQDSNSLTESLNPEIDFETQLEHLHVAKPEIQSYTTPEDNLHVIKPQIQWFAYPEAVHVVKPEIQLYTNPEAALVVKKDILSYTNPDEVALVVKPEVPWYGNPEASPVVKPEIQSYTNPDEVALVVKPEVQWYGNPEPALVVKQEIQSYADPEVGPALKPENEFINIEHIFRPLAEDNKYLTFNRWFIEQLLRFKKMHSPLDVIAVKRQVEKTLQDNNMIVTEEGVLRDYKGNILDMTSLELRPVFLGEPVGYTSLLGRHNKKLKFHNHEPYLEGLLVSLDYKVLGVIPVGKTFMPQESINAPAVNVMSTNMQSPNVVTLSSERDGLRKLVTDPIITHKYLPPKLNKDVTSGLHKLKSIFGPENNDGKYDNGVNSKSYYDYKSKDDTYVSNFLDSLFEIVSYPNRRKGKKSDSLDESGEKSIVKHDGDVVKPGFRIIGGSAATGSGTPLSNRGRSGSE